MRYCDLYRRAVTLLQQSGIAEPQADAWELFEFVTGINRTRYFLVQEEDMLPEQEEHFCRMIEKRQEHIPLQYLTNRQYFCGLEFYVNEDVLIPRQDTECLVEEVCKVIKDGDRILDLCTGSGCILLSIEQLSGKNLSLTGSDLSENALQVAKKNAENLRSRAEFVQGDLFERITGEYDVIVSNPPYIATKEIAHLSPEVKDHEPYSALDGREDGLYFYRRIVKEAALFLKTGGHLLFEIGYDQGESVSRILKEEGYEDIRVNKDLAGLDRVVAGIRQ